MLSVVQQVSSAINHVLNNCLLSDTDQPCCVACRSRKREHLQTLQVRLGQLEQDNARLTQKLSQQDAELDKFRQGLPSHHPGTQSSHFSFLSIRLAFRFASLTLVSD